MWRDAIDPPDPVPPDDAARVRLVVADASWGRRYREAAAELAEALGDAMRSREGVLLELHHVGSTAVPGLATKPTLDLMGRLASWPMNERARRVLAGLGYTDHGEHGLRGRRFLTRGGHDVHLHLLEPGSARLREHLAFRNLLIADAAARDLYGAVKRRLVGRHDGTRAAYVGGKAETVRRLGEEALEHASRRTGFAPIADMARRVEAAALEEARSGVEDDGAGIATDRGAWAVGGGWALDLALGRVTRGHDDVDVVLARDTADAWLAAVAAQGVAFRTRHGASGAPWRSARPLPGDPPLLDARVGALIAASPAWQPDGEAPCFWEVAVEPRPAGAWILRTDPEVTMPIERAVARRRPPGATSLATVPALSPEVVLACKARLSGRDAGEAKDVADLDAAIPLLDGEARDWLRAALRRPPEHPWADRLAD